MGAPKLDTSLDTSSLFGDDMFDFGNAKKNGGNGSRDAVGLAAPKIASNSVVNTSGNQHANPPVPPSMSYNPSTSPTATRFSNSSAYTNIFTTSHMDLDRAPTGSNNESSPYPWDPKPADESVVSHITTNSARNARNLTPGQKLPTVGHSRSDSLEAPTLRSSMPKPRNANHDHSGLKRTSVIMMRRQSFSYEDQDAAIVASSVPHHGRPRVGHSNTSPASFEAGKKVAEKAKDRDSGWEETVPSGSSHASLRSTGSSVLSMAHGNTDTPRTQYAAVSNNTTPRVQKSERPGVQLTDSPKELDHSFTASATLAANFGENTEKQHIPTNKVMTRAQFERYQQQQEEERKLAGKSEDDEDSEDSDYEEETEAEKNKEIARQRARQEAHLAVYRQQMMKISGTDPSDTPLMGINGRQASLSTPALPLIHSNADPGSSGKNSDSEDDEVPLGILLAHGFPSKNRPPTRLSNASSQPNLRGAAQQDLRLPVFARHLPADPYNVGAGLVNPTHRLSLAYGGGSDARSTAGGSMYNGIPPSPRGPHGLVGEIVRVQEMKAARRGGGHASHFSQQPTDPFKQDPFERPSSRGGGMLGLGGGMPSPVPMGNNMGGMGGGMMSNGMMGGNAVSPGMGMGNLTGPGMGMGVNAMGRGIGTPMGMPMGGMGGGLSQPDPMQQQMQIQQQYLQLQMQYMQMQLQMQNSSQQQLPLPILEQRPMLMSTMNNPNTPGQGGMPPQGQHTMSMMNSEHPQLQPSNMTSYTPSIAPSHLNPTAPNKPGFLGPPGYAPSLAPSERSNVGLPSRYRPVSYQTGTSTGARTASLPGPSNLKNTTVESDEDDETAWEELNKKRKEKKQGGKKTDGSKGVLNFGSTTAPSS